MVIRMEQPNLIVSRCNGQVMLCSITTGQKLIITDETLKKSPDNIIIKHYQSLNMFNTNGRR